MLQGQPGGADKSLLRLQHLSTFPHHRQAEIVVRTPWGEIHSWTLTCCAGRLIHQCLGAPLTAARLSSWLTAASSCSAGQRHNDVQGAF